MKSLNLQRKINLLLSLSGNFFLIWFFFIPLISGDKIFSENSGMMFMGIEFWILVCEGVLNYSREAYAKTPDYNTKYTQTFKLTFLIIFSLVWVGMAALAMNNLYILLFFAVSLASKFFLHFADEIKADSRPIMMNLVILTLSIFAAAVFFPSVTGSVWGIIYYTALMCRSVYQYSESG